MSAPAVARIKAVLSGAVAGGSRWNVTNQFTFLHTGPVTNAVLLGATADFVAAYDGIWTVLKTLNQAATTFDTVHLYHYPASSTASDADASQSTAYPVALGDTGGPASQAIVLSTKTALSGRSGRGRMYWPATARLTGGPSTMGFDSSLRDSFVTACQTTYNLLRSDGAGDLTGVTLGVESSKLGIISDCNAVLADARPDRIEHREKGLAFTRTSRPLALV